MKCLLCNVVNDFSRYGNVLNQGKADFIWTSFYIGWVRINVPLCISSMSRSTYDLDTQVLFQKIAHPILYKTLWKEQFEWLTMELYRVNIAMLHNNTLSMHSFSY